MQQLTLEVIFKPDGDGKFAQRFMHLGTLRGERIMFETRVKSNGTWYFDAHTQQADGLDRLTLIDSTLTHPTDRWYGAALVLDGKTATTYIDGMQELTGKIDWRGIAEGISSIGVRQNLVDYFKGSIYKIRVTPRVLEPEAFLKDYEALNRAE